MDPNSYTRFKGPKTIEEIDPFILKYGFIPVDVRAGLLQFDKGEITQEDLLQSICIYTETIENDLPVVRNVLKSLISGESIGDTDLKQALDILNKLIY